MLALVPVCKRMWLNGNAKPLCAFMTINVKTILHSQLSPVKTQIICLFIMFKIRNSIRSQPEFSRKMPLNTAVQVCPVSRGLFLERKWPDSRLLSISHCSDPPKTGSTETESLFQIGTSVHWGHPCHGGGRTDAASKGKISRWVGGMQERCLKKDNGKGKRGKGDR